MHTKLRFMVGLIDVMWNKYWILNARNTIRHQIHKCLKCYRFRAKGQTQIMGDLPTPRVNVTRTFTHTGVDYAGSLEILIARGRGKSKTTKGYISLFVCLATKAIHLKLVTDLSTPAFLQAFRRFAGRRGIPSNMYSDNGTNFVGANNLLKKEFAKVQTEIAEIVVNQEVHWNFIPPSSPHFGGLWEAGSYTWSFPNTRHNNTPIKPSRLKIALLGSLEIRAKTVSTFLETMEVRVSSKITTASKVVENPKKY